MNNTDKVDMFRQYCKQLLEEEIDQLAKQKDNVLLKGKLARIQLFNEHLEILKQNLQHKVNSIIGGTHFTSIPEYHKLESKLNEMMQECVNDYMCSSFAKNI